MKSRAAVFIAPGEPLAVEEVEISDPALGEVLVRNLYSGICHSQLHQMFGPRAVPGPFLMGHEATSIVEAVGDGVTHVQPGDKVFVTWIPRDAAPGDGPPPPLQSTIMWRGQNIARGIYTWGEHTIARQELIVKVPQDVPDDVTSIIGCAVMTGAGAAINTADVQEGESAAVFGVGGVGLSCVVGLAVRGADPIIAIDLDDEKLEFARQFGATITINAGRQDAIEEIIKITGKGRVNNFGKQLSELDYAFDCIGRAQTIHQIVEAVRAADITVGRGGTAVLVGVPDGEASIDALDMLRGEKIFKASYGGSCRPDRDFPIFLRWFNEGLLDLNVLVTEKVKLDDINETCDRLHDGNVLGRSVIEF